MRPERLETYLAGLARFGWHLGLERITALLAALGHPEGSFPAVQVAGTNGKGSTAAMLATILAAAGYRTGLYTSPHLERYQERFVLLERRPPGPLGGRPGGRPGVRRRMITERRLAALLQQVAPVADRVGQATAGPPTEFEVLTAVAALWFAAEQVDLAVLEAGLGGRLDATTIVPAVLSVITHVDLDHTDRLGETLTAIAGEKAAIIRPGRPVVVAPQEAEAWAVIARRAAEEEAPLLPVRSAVEELTWRHTAFSYQPPAGLAPAGEWRGVRTALLGPHQATNAATALTAALALRPLGFTVGEEEARRGLAAARWPGRFEVLRRRPLAVVDGAHNPDGMRRLRETWCALAPGIKPVVVCGFLKDKAVSELVALLSGLAAEVIVTRPASERAAAPEAVAAEFAAHDVPVQSVPDPPEAARLAFTRLAATAAGGAVLGCGSLYLVGALRRTFRRGTTGTGGTGRG